MSSITFTPTVCDRAVAFLQNAADDRGYYVLGSSIGRIATSILSNSQAASQLTKDFSQGVELISIPLLLKEASQLIQALETLISGRTIKLGDELLNLPKLLYDLCSTLAVLSRYHVIHGLVAYSSSFSVIKALIILANCFYEIPRIIYELISSEHWVKIQCVEGERNPTGGNGLNLPAPHLVGNFTLNGPSPAIAPHALASNASRIRKVSYSIGWKIEVAAFIIPYLSRSVEGIDQRIDELNKNAIAAHILNHRDERFLALCSAVSIAGIQGLVLAGQFFAFAASPYAMPILGVTYLASSLSKTYYQGYMALESEKLKKHGFEVSF
jgi:hypothetical protein